MTGQPRPRHPRDLMDHVRDTVRSARERLAATSRTSGNVNVASRVNRVSATNAGTDSAVQIASARQDTVIRQGSRRRRRP